MAKQDSEREAHKAWLGLIQPTGLVVSPPALLKAQVTPDRNVVTLTPALAAALSPSALDDGDPLLLDFPRFAIEVLGWSKDDLAGAPGGPPLPDALAVALPDYGEILRPTYVALDGLGDSRPLLLIVQAPTLAALDEPVPDAAGWPASPQARLERLLRDTGVPAGLLCNGATLRLVYAPRGESSGHLGFPVAELGTVAGRPLLAALVMLLGEHRVFGAPDGQRLLDILAESRKYQSEVSNRLSEQVLGALWELLRGFQAADEAAHGRVLHALPRTDPQQIYGGLLTVIMRLVFLLYAEDQGLLPDDPVYQRNYAIGGLFERLREDQGHHPDTLDQRFGAWAWLLSTFRFVFDGGGHGPLRLPTRHGQLFNPDSYPFLEGRPPGVHRVMGAPVEVPRVADGVIWRVLERLLMLDGERLSYRALDVEQVGSVYESMMGFDVATLPGRALALRPRGVVIDVDALLRQPGARRAAWVKEQAECDLSAGASKELAEARDADDVVAALGRKVAPQTPRALQPGALFLQPGEERRRSGSHYTPRELTEPIVRTTLRPVLDALGPRPTPEQILALKVCDPAMGSGAFLVESCRQLAAALVASWELHGRTPKLPPDEDPLLHARRLVAQRCLYGVDRNPFAVHLAKLSLWLVTLARDHAFTFLDHALKHGDSLVGLTKAQIGAFHWSPPVRDWGPLFKGVSTSVEEASRLRGELQRRDEGDYDERARVWRDADEALLDTRLIGDLCVAAYFGADKDKERERLRLEVREKVDAWRAGRADRGELEEIVAGLRGGARPVPVFHWEIEFPEVFGRENPGFDAVVGNPPFLGGNYVWPTFGAAYRDFLLALHLDSGGKAVDLVIHFFRRAFGMLREGGTTGLIATNTIGQGTTRIAGLKQIVNGGGQILEATRRVRWPGLAAVVVSVVYVGRGVVCEGAVLDGRPVRSVNSYLAPGIEFDPVPLRANEGASFIGTYVLGMGFTFDDNCAEGRATSLAEMDQIIRRDRRNAERIFPYIGGEEVNTGPTHAHHRFVINFEDFSLERANEWPDLLDIVRQKVKPDRDELGGYSVAEGRKLRWWQFGTYTRSLYDALNGLNRVLAIARVSTTFSVAFLPAGMVYSEGLVVFPFNSGSAFAVLQCRIHELWAQFFGSSMKDDLRYSPSGCFDPFPTPNDWSCSDSIVGIGDRYHEFRAALMIRNDEGLTKTYNRFHDPTNHEPDIVRLRELHAAMDRAVLDAYGWTDIPTDCEFLLDYEIDEETWGNKKKPYRYRWPDAVRDEVLARLLDLNQRRYQEEVAAGLHGKPDRPAPQADKARPGKPAAPRARKSAPSIATPAQLPFATRRTDGDDK